MDNKLSKELAAGLARKAALFDLDGIFSGDPNDVLDFRVDEADQCWMFFRNRSIVIPPERSLSDFAYVFAKDTRLGGRCVPDYRGDEKRLQEYLKHISDHFGMQSALLEKASPP